MRGIVNPFGVGIFSEPFGFGEQLTSEVDIRAGLVLDYLRSSLRPQHRATVERVELLSARYQKR